MLLVATCSEHCLIKHSLDNEIQKNGNVDQSFNEELRVGLFRFDAIDLDEFANHECVEKDYVEDPVWSTHLDWYAILT